VPRQGHNTPIPLKRSAPASFKRLLGGTLTDARLRGHDDSELALGTKKRRQERAVPVWDSATPSSANRKAHDRLVVRGDIDGVETCIGPEGVLPQWIPVSAGAIGSATEHP